MDGPKVSGPPTLPARFTRFFGREAEINEIEGLATRVRLSTLVGAPGCGKTRLSIEVGERLNGRFADGVRFVELAPISGPRPTDADDASGQARYVWNAIAWALGIGDEPGRADEDTVTDALSAADLLLIIDNCDEFVDGAAEVVRRLVGSCPTVRVMATSRVPLGLPGEQVCAVPPLDIRAAVELFSDRADLVSGLVQVPERTTPVDGVSLEDICDRLGQLPLAIELTAAWTRVLSPGQILARLDDPRLMLQSEARGLSPRQATMEATIDWSYQLLEPTEQRLFDRLSVFCGGFDLEAAEALALDGEDVLGGLSSLVDHSLVLAETATDEPMRYRLLEPLRQFGEARLLARGEGDSIRRRHAEYYLEVARRCDRELRGGQRALVLHRLDQDDGNLHQALEWVRTQRSDLGLHLCLALSTFFELRGRVNDGRAWMDWALQVGTADRRLRAAALSRAGRLAWRQNEFARARALMEESLAIEREHGDPSSIARRLRGLALVEMSGGDLRVAAQLAEQSLHIFRAQDDEQGVLWTLIHLGWARFALGDVVAGRQAMRQAFDANRTVGIGAVTVNALLGLAHDAVISEDLPAQRRYLTDALTTLEKVGGDAEELMWLWIGAGLAAGEGRFGSAVRLAGGAGAQSGRHGGSTNRRFLTYLEPLIEQAEDAVGLTAADRLRADGARMTWDELASEVLAEPGDADHPLSPREQEITSLVADGLSNVEIAERLFISKRTVESHVDHIKQKLGFTTRHQIIAWSVRDSLPAAER